MSKRILIIEDEEPIIHALNKLVGPRGYTLLEALTGPEGLRLALETHPDLILLDILLPEMDGIELLEKLREDEWGSQAKVLVITNLTHKEKEARAKELGILDYIVKSNIRIHELAERIELYLNS